MAGIPAGRLSIEIVAEIARLQSDLDKAKRAVKAASGDIAASARSANDNLAGMSKGMAATAPSAKAAAFGMRNLAFQAQDLGVQLASAAGSSDPLRMAFMAFVQQGPQIRDAFNQTGKSVIGLITGFLSAHPLLVALTVAAGVAAAAFKLFQGEINKSAELDKYAASLGLTKEEMGKLTDVGVTAGDMFKGLWRTIDQGLGAGRIFSTIKSWAVDAFKTALEWVNNFAAGAWAAFMGTGKAVIALGTAAKQALSGDFAGALATVKAIPDGYVSAFGQAKKAMSGFYADWRSNSIAVAKERISGQAAKLIDDRTEKKLKDEAKEKGSLLGDILSGAFLGQMTVDLDKKLNVKVEWGGPTDLGEQMKAINDVREGVQRLADYDLQVLHDQLELTADLAGSLGDSLSEAFGKGGRALGDMVKILGEYGVRQQEIDKTAGSAAERQKRSSDLQLTSLIGLTGAAKGFFKEHSAGYKAMAAAEKALTIVQLARTAIDVAGGAARMFATLGPYAFPAVAAMLGVMASLGFGGGGGGAKLPQSNEGKGTVFGDSDAKSESLKRSVDFLADIDGETLVFTRQMAASLKNIESQIGGVTNLVLRNGLDDVAGKMNVQTGFKTSFLGKALGGGPGGLVGAMAGSLLLGPLGALLGNVVGNLFSKVIYKIPVIGDILGGIGKVIGSLFGTKKTVVGSGIYGGPQSLGSIDEMGFAGQTFADIKSTKKFFGIKAGSKYSTQYGALADDISNQFGLLLTSFGDAIKLAAGPLGIDLDAITGKLDSFVVDIGKINLDGLTGDEIQEKLEAVFGAQADKMAQYAVAGLEKFQQVGEGYFETLIRVASTVEAVASSLDQLGLSATSLGTDASMAIAGFFGSVSDYQSAAGAYFQTFYSDAEQAAAKTAQLGKVFDSLGIAMPDSIASFRALVEAQDLTTASGQQMYAALLQLAPAFAEITSGARNAASAASILRERNDLERQMLELNGDTAKLRELDLAAVDPSNRALLAQIQARQDEIAAEQAAQQAAEQARQAAEQAAAEAAATAQRLVDAWHSVGDAIMDEVRRIRGELAPGGQSYASLQKQFQTATDAARGGNIDAAKLLPGLSQALLDAATAAATDGRMLQRIKAITAASLERTYGVIAGSIPGFADGGMHAGGLRVVGENGPELEATGPSRIWNADQIAAAVAGSADPGAIGQAVALALRPYLFEIAKNTLTSSKLADKWDGEGLPPERDAA